MPVVESLSGNVASIYESYSNVGVGIVVTQVSPGSFSQTFFLTGPIVLNCLLMLLGDSRSELLSTRKQGCTSFQVVLFDFNFKMPKFWCYPTTLAGWLSVSQNKPACYFNPQRIKH